MADQRVATGPDKLMEFGRALAKAFGTDFGEATLAPEELRFVQAVAAELRQANGRGLILAGEAQPAALHALAHFLNAQLQAPIDLVPAADPVADDHSPMFSMLMDDIHSGMLRTMIVLESNPVYDSAAATETARTIAAIPFSVHCGLYQDETAEHCRWHLPLSHTLEGWGDIQKR